MLRDAGVHSLAMVPLTTAQRRLGAMGFGTLLPQKITDTELAFMQRVASQVAVAVDNALNLETSQAYQAQLSEERDRLRVLLEINNVLVTSRELPELFRGIVSTLERVIHHDYTSLALLEPATGLLKIYALDFPGREDLIKQEVTVPRDSLPLVKPLSSGKPVCARGAELDAIPAKSCVCCARTEFKPFAACRWSHAVAPSARSTSPAAAMTPFPDGTWSCCSKSPRKSPSPWKMRWPFKEIDALKDKLAEEKLYLEEEIRSEFNFEEIIGDAPSLKRPLGPSGSRRAH